MNFEGRTGQPNNRAFQPRLTLSAVVMLSIALTPFACASAQSLPALDFSGRSADKRPDLLEKTTPDLPAPVSTLPVPPAPAREPAGALVQGVFARRFVVTGSTVFTEEELARLTAPYLNRAVTMADLESLRRDLTLHYVTRGYVNSGVIIPDQAVADGEITLQIVEGRLSRIDIAGNEHFSGSFLKARIARGAQVPLNITPLQERLQFLQQDARIQRIHAELRPGGRPGEGELKVKVEEKPPFSVWLAFNNYQSPSVGAERGLVTLAHQNLTGHGDVLSLTYGYSEGLNPLIDTSYAVPVNAYDTTLLFRYRKNDAKVVDRVFGPLDIVSKSEGFEFGLRQPVYRTLNHELAIALSGEYVHTESSLSGEPMSFSPGVENGESTVAPLRFAQEWTYRTKRQVIAARSRFSFGLDALGATVHDRQNNTNPDGRFFAWLGQLQWARVLEVWDIQLLSRLDLQRASHSLLPAEQMGVGGRYTVRGYRENLLVRDQALIASLEARVPLLQNERWAEYFQVGPFLDYGRGTNVNIPTSGPNDIASIGLGLRWGAAPFKLPFGLKTEAEIFWGHRLRTVNMPSEDLQDDGIHYQFAVTGIF